jgi:cytochrome c-type biogenesis protein CcmH/NrfG
VYVDHLVVEGDDEVDLVADYERAAELMPNDPSVADMYAQALFFDAWFTGDRAVGDRAIAAAERSVELDPTYSRLWNQLGLARLRFSPLPRDERLASAREAYETALTRSPWSTAAMSALFQISLEQGRPDEARDWLIALCAAGRCPRISS